MERNTKVILGITLIAAIILVPGMLYMNSRYWSVTPRTLRIDENASWHIYYSLTVNTVNGSAPVLQLGPRLDAAMNQSFINYFYAQAIRHTFNESSLATALRLHSADELYCWNGTARVARVIYGNYIFSNYVDHAPEAYVFEISGTWYIAENANSTLIVQGLCAISGRG